MKLNIKLLVMLVFSVTVMFLLPSLKTITIDTKDIVGA